MNEAEITLKVVAILTETSDWVRGDGPSMGAAQESLKLIGDLVGDLTRLEVAMPSDATPQEAVNTAMAALGPVLGRAFGAFTTAFHSLAQEHDQNAPTVTSTEVLRKLALEAESDR